MTRLGRFGGPRVGLLAAVVSLLFVGFGAASCVGEAGLETYACPNKPDPNKPDDFTQSVFGKSVSPFLERRCGTLDCHGQMTRPMRIFSEFGLRHPLENNVTGGNATTLLELQANFAAVCNVQPAMMQEVFDDRGVAADKLLIVNKARGLERHKGGKIVNVNDGGDRCLLGWLGLKDNAVVEADCAAAIAPLE